MDIKTIDSGLSISPQIAPSDIAAIKAAGYRAIICNRPDGEGDDQPSFGEIKAAAEAEGLEVQHLPIVPGKMCAEDAEAFADALIRLPGPVLAYCRSGARSENVWKAGL